MMYSSSPNLIKHFVSMNFSKTSIDYRNSPIKQIQESDNPLTNKKLQKLQGTSKDFVLIFKNKSSKTFRAKKKVQYSPLLKNLKLADDIYELGKQSSQQMEKMQRQNPIKAFSREGRKHPRTPVTLRKSFQLRKSQGKLTERKYISSASGTLRSTYLSWKGVQEKENNTDYDKLLKSEEKYQEVCALKIWGNKAPKSETVDHFKKYGKDGYNEFMLRLVK